MDEIYKNLDLNNLPNEIWLPIEGYEDKYQVSSYGRIKSLKDNKGNSREKILRQEKNNKSGYLCVTLCKDNKVKTCYVHRLVGNAFLENPNGYRCVNHKNEIKTDNRVENLEWCDDKYNLNYKNAQARRVASTDWKAVAEKLTNRQDLSKQVYQYDKDGNLIKIWDSTMECGRNGYTQSAVAKCCKNCFNIEGNNVYKGYIWSYTPIHQK